MLHKVLCSLNCDYRSSFLAIIVYGWFHVVLKDTTALHELPEVVRWLKAFTRLSPTIGFQPFQFLCCRRNDVGVGSVAVCLDGHCQSIDRHTPVTLHR